MQGHSVTKWSDNAKLVGHIIGSDGMFGHKPRIKVTKISEHTSGGPRNLKKRISGYTCIACKILKPHPFSEGNPKGNA